MRGSYRLDDREPEPHALAISLGREEWFKQMPVGGGRYASALIHDGDADRVSADKASSHRYAAAFLRQPLDRVRRVANQIDQCLHDLAAVAEQGRQIWGTFNRYVCFGLRIGEPEQAPDVIEQRVDHDRLAICFALDCELAEILDNPRGAIDLTDREINHFGVFFYTEHIPQDL